MPHHNERVELAMKLLECGPKLRRIGWDLEQAERLRAGMERLERKLREIDEAASLGGTTPYIECHHVAHRVVWCGAVKSLNDFEDQTRAVVSDLEC